MNLKSFLRPLCLLGVAIQGGTAAVVGLSGTSSPLPSSTSEQSVTSLATSAGQEGAGSTKLDPVAIALAITIALVLVILLFIIRSLCVRQRKVIANSKPQVVSSVTSGKVCKVELKADEDDEATIAEPALTYDPHSPARVGSMMAHGHLRWGKSEDRRPG